MSTSHLSSKRVSFGSDNHAGVHPQVLSKISEVDSIGDVGAYGGDPVTAQALEIFKKQFGEKSETFFVFNGTAANVLALSAFVPAHGSILCAEKAHIAVDECGAPEKWGGFKLDLVSTPDQKLKPELLENRFSRLGDQHSNQPRAISISQTTEYGTLYSLEELKKLGQFARAHHLVFHIDGARISNAVASLGCSFREMTIECGVDVLSFGGTKNGLLGAEAVVFMDGSRAREFPWLRKQGMQLASKMRYQAAQFLAFFEGDLGLKNALHANSMATFLAGELEKIPGVKVTQKVQGNAVFASMDLKKIESVRSRYGFYVWDQSKSEVRLMASWKTTREDVLDLVDSLKQNLK